MKTLLLMIFGPNMTADKFALNVHDFVKGLYLSLAPVGVLFIDTFMRWTATPGAPLVIDWQTMWKMSLGIFVMYIIKNYFSSPPK